MGFVKRNANSKIASRCYLRTIKTNNKYIEGIIVTNLALEKIVNRFRAQIGEYLWHSFTGSEHIDAKTAKFYGLVKDVVEKFYMGKKISILELAPSKNYIAYLLADQYMADVTVMDMSRHSLLEGCRIAREHGLKQKVRMVASDFHSLPFDNSEFDLVYMSGAIHHCKNPTIIFNEVARILKKSGLFYLINEPCKRELSLYEFNCNRIGGGAGITLFEKFLYDSGFLGVFSYPVDGGRPEDLFGMTENWSIPLSTFTKEQSSHFELLDEKYEPTPLTEQEEQLVACTKGDPNEFKEKILNTITTIRDDAKKYLKEKEILMGFSLPSDSKIQELAERNSQIFCENDNTLHGSTVERNKILSMIFGGRVTCLYKKIAEPSHSTKLCALPNLPQSTGEYLVPMKDGEFVLDLSASVLHNIQETPWDLLKNNYPSQDWEHIIESDGKIVSLLNRKNIAYVKINKTIINGILLIRYYAIEIEAPYIVSIYLNNELLVKHNIVRSETRSFIQGFSEISGSITFTLTDLNGTPLELPAHLRLGVLQLIQIQNGNHENE